jgi:hypothetical protein
VAFSSQANYIDWATAVGRRILAPTFAYRGVTRGQRGTSPRPLIFGFIDQSRYYFFQVAPQLSSRGWVDSVSDPVLLKKSDTAVNRTRDLWDCSQELWPLDHGGEMHLLLPYYCNDSVCALYGSCCCILGVGIASCWIAGFRSGHHIVFVVWALIPYSLAIFR